MSSLDLYDDLFPDETCRRNETAEATGAGVTKSSLLNASDANINAQMKEIQEYNQRLEKELGVLKSENKNWQLVYCDVQRKLEISKSNITILLNTAKNEIGRKNDTISCLKKELDNILFKRALKSGTVEELKEMIGKIHSAFQIEIGDRIQLEIARKSGENAEHKPTSKISNKIVSEGTKNHLQCKYLYN